MKYYAGQKKQQLDVGLSQLLKQLRAGRNFDATRYIEAKTRLVNDYFRRAGLKAAVVAVSGGIDSAVVLSLMVKAQSAKGSPIEKVVPLSLPVHRSQFTTNQDKAVSRAIEVIKKNGLEEVIYDLSLPYDHLKEVIDQALQIKGEPWASGQLVSYLRTPAIYYTTSLLNQQGLPSIVCGTTNRDEGAYLGFVGKASDGMVDLQIVSDLHKSEIRAVAKVLGVPKSILNAVPTGDMFDGRVDEEVFGASYDFVELFLLLRSLDDEALRESLLKSLPAKAKAIYKHLSANVEDLHRYNAHKYLVGSPAVHMNVLESGVKGGWTYGLEKIDRKPTGEKYFVNPFSFSQDVHRVFAVPSKVVKPKEKQVYDGTLLEFPKVLEKKEVQFLLNQADKHGYQPVGVDGYMSHYKEGDPIGSLRASVFSADLASILWHRLSPYFENPRVFTDKIATDIGGSGVWRPIGVSPLFRYIKYTSGGLLVPHYDAPFIASDKQRTLMSLVLYLAADGVTGGETRFIKDPQAKTPFDQKDFSDWQRFAKKNEILFEVVPKAGAAISFDHRILHDSSEIKGEGQKVIIRTDIVFARC